MATQPPVPQPVKRFGSLEDYYHLSLEHNAMMAQVVADLGRIATALEALAGLVEHDDDSGVNFVTIHDRWGMRTR